ncbi:GFA family protein [uncultured Photobacterium sp.]|uniref:GFA family protein n=1 Tax=uncultured Photobacterium sp. TaxID=173973 RepID=UPI00262F2E38|nr:GFA family protein [uncultured Photobacterium sp.]
MKTLISGRCRCGEIVYELLAEPTHKYLCYCRDCQYFTGTDKIFVVRGPRSTFSLCRGNPQSYDVVADSGATITRAFCGTCGSSLFIYPKIDHVYYFDEHDVICVAAATLDDPNMFCPEFAVFVSRAPAWAMFPKGIELHQ